MNFKLAFLLRLTCLFLAVNLLISCVSLVDKKDLVCCLDKCDPWDGLVELGVNKFTGSICCRCAKGTQDEPAGKVFQCVVEPIKVGS